MTQESWLAAGANILEDCMENLDAENLEELKDIRHRLKQLRVHQTLNKVVSIRNAAQKKVAGARGRSLLGKLRKRLIRKPPVAAAAEPANAAAADQPAADLPDAAEPDTPAAAAETRHRTPGPREVLASACVTRLLPGAGALKDVGIALDTKNASGRWHGRYKAHVPAGTSKLLKQDTHGKAFAIAGRRAALEDVLQWLWAKHELLTGTTRPATACIEAIDPAEWGDALNDEPRRLLERTPDLPGKSRDDIPNGLCGQWELSLGLASLA